MWRQVHQGQPLEVQRDICTHQGPLGAAVSSVGLSPRHEAGVTPQLRCRKCCPLPIHTCWLRCGSRGRFALLCWPEGEAAWRLHLLVLALGWDEPAQHTMLGGTVWPAHQLSASTSDDM